MYQTIGKREELHKLFKAAYLHKFCVQRKFAGVGMTSLVTETIRTECRNRGNRYIRLDTGLDEKAV